VLKQSIFAAACGGSILSCCSRNPHGMSGYWKKK